MSFNIEDFGLLEDRIVAVSDELGTSGWYIAELPTNLDAPEWEQITTPDPDGKMRIIGTMAYQVEDSGDVFWVDALLCNSATELTIDPFIIYIDPRTNLPDVKSWSNNYPDAEGGTPDSMPHAGRCTMWGDFLVLGDINWKADPDQPFNSSNQSRYSHGLWFSMPGRTDKWDPIDTVFTGQKAGGNVVQGMFPLEPGLLVVTCTLVALLQGSPDDFLYRELRAGISNCGRNGVNNWSAKGGVVFGNNLGDVWFTNGESFQRLDEAIEVEDFQSIAAFGEYLFVSTTTGTKIFRLYEEGGGWTSLTGVSGFAKMQATSKFLIGIEAREAGGSFVLDDPVYGDLNSEYTLWSEDRLLTAFDFDSENRGTFNGRDLRSTIRSRPLPGGGHEVRFWHRFGVRAKGSGSVVKATSRPSSDADERGYDTRLRGKLDRRFDYVFDAHGPSLEATFDVQFDGDVSVEHMTVWEHGGRLDK